MITLYLGVKRQVMAENQRSKLSRYDFAQAAWAQKLFEWSRQEGVTLRMGDTPQSVFAAIADYDPTKESSSRFKFLFWICQTIIQDKIKPEDVYKIEENLETYMKIQGHLPPEKRDLNQIKTARELETIVLPHQNGKIIEWDQLDQKQQERILAETEILYQGEDGTILSPKTRRASEFWGQGTKWCVSKKNSVFFDFYNIEGSLVIYILNQKAIDPETNTEYQVKIAGHRYDRVLRDYRDRTLEDVPQSLQDMLLRSNELGFCMKHGCIKPNQFPRDTFTEEFLSERLKDKSVKLRDIHEEERTVMLSCLSVVSNPWSFGDILPHTVPMEIYEKLCLVAIKAIPFALSYVREEKVRPEVYEALCVTAVTLNKAALDIIHEEKRTQRIIDAYNSEDIAKSGRIIDMPAHVISIK